MKNSDIAAVKGLAIIGVVLNHLTNRRLAFDTRSHIGILTTAFCWCVFAFFATAGWLHALKEEKQKQSFLAFSVLRLRRLMVPFVVLILIYAAVWQVVQSHSSISMRDVLATSYTGKVLGSLWPVGARSVGAQLYFLPLLLAISISAHLALRLGGRMGIVLLGAVTYVIGLAFYANSEDTGFYIGVLVWGCFSYCGGFLLYQRDKSTLTRGVLAALIIPALLVAGLPVIGKFAALALIVAAPYLRFSSIPFLVALGDASGTIYIYHTPFILQPLLIFAARVNNPLLQFLATLLAGALAAAACALLYISLKDTRFRRILL